VHPEGSGDVARRSHHAALAAADNDRLVGEFRIVALLNGCVKGVAIYVRKGERGQRAVARKTRGTAYAASAHRDVQVDEAIPAKAGWRGRFWCG
jgi:hypothetical protein